MNPIALHIVNGDAFFVGAGVLLLVGGVSGWWRGRWGGVGLRILTVIGVLLVVLSATPLAFWFPKRYFAQVLARPENTFDGLHPTQAGHDRLAEMMGRVLGP